MNNTSFRAFPIVVVMLCALAVFATGLSGFQQDDPLKRIENLARAAQPEFAADVLIKIVERHSAPAERRLELLEEAFELSAFAKEPIRMHAPGRDSFSVPGLIGGLGYSQGIDRLSLRSRIVQKGIPLGAERATRWLEEIALPELPRLSCTDDLSYNFEAFYDAVSAQLAVSEDLESKSRILLRAVQNLKSPGQMRLMAKILSSTDLPDADVVLLVSWVSTALNTMDAEPLSYADAYPAASVQALGDLSNNLRSRGVSVDGYLRSLRKYIVAHESKDACAVGRKASETRCALFNRYLPPNSNIEPLADKDCEPQEVRQRSRVERLDEIEPWKEIYRVIEKLGGASPEEKRQTEWKASTFDLLVQLDRLRPESKDSEIAFFVRKGNAYLNLLRMREEAARALPSRGIDEEKLFANLAVGELRPKLIADTVGFVTSDIAIRIRRQSPAAWMSIVGPFLDFVTAFDVPSARTAAEVMLTAGDPTIALYGELVALGKSSNE